MYTLSGDETTNTFSTAFLRGSLPCSALKEAELFQERQCGTTGNLASRLLSAKTLVGIPSNPIITPPAGWKEMICLLMLHTGQTDLLQIVGALHALLDWRADCTAGNSNAIKMPMIVMTTPRVPPR